MQYRIEEITYSIRKHARAKQLKLSVFADGDVRITIPRWAAKRDAHAFIQERIPWIREQLQALEQESPQKKVLPTDTPATRKKARAIIVERLAQLNAEYYQQTIGRVTVRNTKSRWGSCSSENNLNFSYKVAFLPPELRDYVLIHELCHITHLNHSPAFWELVGHADPRYASHRKELKQYQ